MYRDLINKINLTLNLMLNIIAIHNNHSIIHSFPNIIHNIILNSTHNIHNNKNFNQLRIKD